MRISDWSSDVCSSDLRIGLGGAGCLNRLQIGQGCRVIARLEGGGHFLVLFIETLRELARCIVLVPVPAVSQIHARSGFQTKTMNRSEEHTSELQSLIRISYAVLCLTTKRKTKHHT